MSRESDLTQLWLKRVESELSQVSKFGNWIESVLSQSRKVKCWVESELSHLDCHMSQSRVESARKIWVEHNPGRDSIPSETVQQGPQEAGDVLRYRARQLHVADILTGVSCRTTDSDDGRLRDTADDPAGGHQKWVRISQSPKILGQLRSVGD